MFLSVFLFLHETAPDAWGLQQCGILTEAEPGESFSPPSLKCSAAHGCSCRYPLYDSSFRPMNVNQWILF